MLLVGYSIIVDNWKESGHERYCCGYRCGDISNHSQLGAVADRAHAEQSCFYPGITGFLGSMILLVLSFTVIGGWEGIAYAFFSVPILLISGLLLLLLVSYRRQT